MKLALHTPDSLRQRATTRLTLAAMITSAILAPLLLGTGVALLSRAHTDVAWDMVIAAVLLMFPAAGFGGYAMRRGAMARTDRLLLHSSALCGGLYLPVAILCAYLCTSSGGLRTELLVVGLVSALVGLMSVPMGFALGLLFMSATSPVLKRLDHPAQDTPAAASISSATMLLIATLVAFGAAAMVADTYVAFLAREADLHAPAWTCIALFTSPLALAAFLSLAIGAREARALERMRHAIVSGAHPEYYPGDIPSDEAATPLTERDRKSAKQRVLVARTAGAYRGESRTSPVFVGVP